MHRVLSIDLWAEVTAVAKKAKRRQAAIAFVTRDLLHFKKGDILIVNCSTNAISNGETDAPLLRALRNRGVQIYGCVELHAKVILLDNVAVIGSANMSNRSAGHWVEAAVVTDNGDVVADVTSLLEKLQSRRKPLSANQIEKLCKIEVIQRGSGPGGVQSGRRMKVRPQGNQTWLIGVRELLRKPQANEQMMIDAAAEQLEVAPDELSWIKWPNSARFARECHAEDRLIQIWRSSKAKQPSFVWRSVPVLLKQQTANWTRFYYRYPDGENQTLRWGQFKKLLERLDYPKRVGPTIQQLVDSDMADAISKRWNSAAIS